MERRFWRFFAFLLASFSNMVFDRIFLGFGRGFGAQNWCQNQFLKSFLPCFFGGDLGIDFSTIFLVFFEVRTLIFVRTGEVL